MTKTLAENNHPGRWGQRQAQTRRTQHNSNKVDDLSVFRSMKGGKARPAREEYGKLQKWHYILTWHYSTWKDIVLSLSPGQTRPDGFNLEGFIGFHDGIHSNMITHLFSQSRSCINELSWTLRTPNRKKNGKTHSPFWYPRMIHPTCSDVLKQLSTNPWTWAAFESEGLWWIASVCLEGAAVILWTVLCQRLL